MKRTIDNFLRSIMLVAIALGAGSLAAIAQDTLGGGRLAGTWEAAVTLRDCATGNPLNSFASIANFNQGGTFLGSTSGIPQSSRTPEHGIWRHVRGNMYEFKFKTYNFDASGTAVTYAIVRHDLQLNEKGDGYVSAGEARVYLMNGVQIAQGCSSAVGTPFAF